MILRAVFTRLGDKPAQACGLTRASWSVPTVAPTSRRDPGRRWGVDAAVGGGG